MGTLANFFSCVGLIPISWALPTRTSKKAAASSEEHNKPSFAALGARIGEDNEVLRNLFIDLGHQFSAFDDFRETLGKLAEPLHKLMGSLEHERSENASLRGALAESRANHETLRTEYQVLEKKSSELEDENDRLSRDLGAAQQTAGKFESDNGRLGGDIAELRAALANLQKRLAKEATSVRVLGDQKQMLLERADVADKRIVELEAEAVLARERMSLLETEKDSLRTALDRTLAENSRTARQLAETENALADTRARLQQTERTVAAGEEERKRLVAAYDEANERRQSEVYALGLKHDAVLSRSAVVEKLLAELRQNLAGRSEELRVAEAKLMEETLARNGAEKKIERLTALIEAQDRHGKKREQVHLSLIDRNKVLTESVQAGEVSLAHAEERIRSITERLNQLKTDAEATRGNAEKRIEELNAAIERKRAEHTLAETALEVTRENCAQIQRQIVTERGMRRRTNPAEAFDTVKVMETRQPKTGTRDDNAKADESVPRLATSNTRPH
jgi:chromosome segregation ATPase